ncbi:PTS sugar transporter subunit IIB [Oceanotoga sp. DSM 15011]|jgi:PTS system ascorbate-specific IIB component|uniref:PTS system IIB component (L-Asc family) n=1 Tax=Oceanotoga teriensis TaxID=515440 RepID=A0AA45HHU9_9BACT|nr:MULTISPECIES: PTS sugar transporter subunit IIB [Oceanotoga]MDN5342989.1 ascorbate system component [Oceanotoga sp.]MDO7976176.1 PTS sugar transporter subunit IIB [Oceanotoga teriensis]PWJ88529.1 PTS system IIB component (L-Asc family) [Oceanotoga teriensis]UYP01012.1 PTS sugar transporter subunit IIB [Oceanotoga sp. DSM 15011]
MSRIKVMAVCGFGVGSSMILKMKIDEVAKSNGIDAEVFTSDVGSASSTTCDLVFTSEELGESLKEKMNVPVIIINNFLNKKEVEEKGLEIMKELSK